jgi:hypothetical protein
MVFLHCIHQVGGTYSHDAAVAKPEEIYFKKGFETGLVSGALRGGFSCQYCPSDHEWDRECSTGCED